MPEYDGERLYLLAKANARAEWGAALPKLGPVLMRAVLLAEVLNIIAAQDSEAAAVNMFRLAEYAVVRVLADTKEV